MEEEMNRAAIWNTLVFELRAILPFVEMQDIRPTERFVNIGASSLDRIDLAISISQKLDLADDNESITSLAFSNTIEEFFNTICIRKMQ
jgi:acyl carrier protein